MDKVVVVTGASGGIGAELAKQLAAEGARVVLAARRKDKLDAVAQEIGAQALAVATDVTKKSEVERLAKAAVEHFGRIDVWVNNAGRGISRSVADLSDEDLDAMWTINMKSVVYGIQAVLPHFKGKNAGQIVNISTALSKAPGAPVRVAKAIRAASERPPARSLLQSFAYNFHPGLPDLVDFPREAWLRSMRAALRDSPLDSLGYGDPRGLPALREALAAYLGRVRGTDALCGARWLCRPWIRNRR